MKWGFLILSNEGFENLLFSGEEQCGGENQKESQPEKSQPACPPDKIIPFLPFSRQQKPKVFLVEKI